MQNQPIAVFDSGLGGLSVVRHLRAMLPDEDIVYFGDTARVPYGSKSRRTVVKFALEAARFLMRFEPKLMVAACNTASALALDELDGALPVPVLGVVEPAAAVAAELARTAPVGVIGTEATIASGAYTNAIVSHCESAEVLTQACPLLVPLAEEGRGSDDAIVQLAVETYLKPLREHGMCALVLGCTHYPLLREAISAVLDERVEVIDSGFEASRAARDLLRREGSLCADDRTATIRCFVSDNPTRFRRIGSRFLGQEISDVVFVEPESYISATVLETEPG